MSDQIKNWKDLGLSYVQALHGVQSANLHRSLVDHKFTEFKQTRTGIDSAHVSDRALASLLIEKGIITEEEYVERLRRAMNDELAEHENRMRELLDNPGLSYR